MIVFRIEVECFETNTIFVMMGCKMLLLLLLFLLLISLLSVVRFLLLFIFVAVLLLVRIIQWCGSSRIHHHERESYTSLLLLLLILLLLLTICNHQIFQGLLVSLNPTQRNRNRHLDGQQGTLRQHSIPVQASNNCSRIQ